MRGSLLNNLCNDNNIQNDLFFLTFTRLPQLESYASCNQGLQRVYLNWKFVVFPNVPTKVVRRVASCTPA